MLIRKIITNYKKKSNSKRLHIHTIGAASALNAIKLWFMIRLHVLMLYATIESFSMKKYLNNIKSKGVSSAICILLLNSLIHACVHQSLFEAGYALEYFV